MWRWSRRDSVRQLQHLQWTWLIHDGRNTALVQSECFHPRSKVKCLLPPPSSTCTTSTAAARVQWASPRCPHARGSLPTTRCWGGGPRSTMLYVYWHQWHSACVSVCVPALCSLSSPIAVQPQASTQYSFLRSATLGPPNKKDYIEELTKQLDACQKVDVLTCNSAGTMMFIRSRW